MGHCVEHSAERDHHVERVAHNAKDLVTFEYLAARILGVGGVMTLDDPDTVVDHVLAL